jgi:hypothetical protein
MVRTRADDPSRPEGAPRKKPRWRRGYVPWLTAALVLAGLMAAAIAAIGILTATPQSPRSLTPLLPQHEHAEDRAPGVESISTER